MSHPIIHVLGDVFQLSIAQGFLHALRLEPRRTMLSRTLASLKVLGTGIAIGRGIEMYGETLVDYAMSSRKRARSRTLATAGALAAGLGLGVGAAILLAPDIRKALARKAKEFRTPSVTTSAPSPGNNAAAARAAGI